MISRLIFSFKKSRLLSKIAAESASKPFDISEFLNQEIKNRVQGKTLSKRELYIEQLLSLLSTDKYTAKLLAQYGKTFDDVRKIIDVLESNGAGQVIKGHYIPISSIAFLKQLQTVLQHWDSENFKIDNLDAYNSNVKMAYYLVQSFE